MDITGLATSDVLASGTQDLQLRVTVLGAGTAGAVAPSLQQVVGEVGAGAREAGAGLQGLVQQSGTQVLHPVLHATLGYAVIVQVSQAGQAATGFFKRHYRSTLPGLTSRVRAALNLDLEQGGAAHPPAPPPVSDQQFRSFLNRVGQVCAPREFRLAVYQAGLEPGLRKIAWKHLLNIYPAGLTGGERVHHLKQVLHALGTAEICTVSVQVSAQYYELKADWMNLVLQGRVSDDVKTVMNMVGRGMCSTFLH